jgi:ankyrin repeat protein
MALMAACLAGNVDIAEMLTSGKVNPNYGAGYYGSPLIAATTYGDERLLELLLAAGANPTALISAARSLPAKCLEMLTQRGPWLTSRIPTRTGH